MRIDSPSSHSQLLLPRQAQLALLKLGTQLLARVEVRDGQVSLRLGGDLLPVRTQLPLIDGEVVELEVAALEPQPVLKLLSRIPERDSMLQMALRTLLPRPGATTSAAQTVAQLADLTPDTLPAKASEALHQLFQNLPRPVDLTNAAGLERALRNSGLFLEAALARGADGAGATDLKSLLQRLAARLREGTSSTAPQTASPAGTTAQRPTATSTTEAPAKGSSSTGSLQDAQPALRALATAEAAVTRIGVLQLQAAEQAAGPRDLMFELPVLGEARIEPLSIQIQEEDAAERDDPDAAPGLNVHLALDLEGMGAMSVSVRLAGERVSVFWAAQEADTAALIQNHLEHLEARLREAGLEVAQLDCHQATPLAMRPSVEALRGLLNEKA